ncbi:MAG TPA: hypothetical protein PLK12_15695 [Prolixibacteraceae bacterium]|nr:hypothetical protein [Prolixibacteraceae bacterium]
MMSRLAAAVYATLLIGSALLIHLITNGQIRFRMEWMYVIIGVLIGSGIVLLLQSLLKKI